MKNNIIILSLLTFLITGCSYSTKGGAIGLHRQQYLSSSVPAEKINQEAEKFYRKEVATTKSENRLNTNPAQLQRVRKITNALISQARFYRKDALKWKWEVNVVKTNEANAICMPGGKIFVYSALMDKLNLNDAQLAAVLGHEIAHALREHVRERRSVTEVNNGVGAMFGLAVLVLSLGDVELADDTVNLVSSTGDLLVGKPANRVQEKEADVIGLELMARAGYDPREAVKFWEKTEKYSPTSTSDYLFNFLSTHPTNTDRINILKRAMVRVMPLYEKTIRYKNQFLSNNRNSYKPIYGAYPKTFNNYNKNTYYKNNNLGKIF